MRLNNNGMLWGVVLLLSASGASGAGAQSLPRDRVPPASMPAAPVADQDPDGPPPSNGPSATSRGPAGGDWLGYAKVSAEPGYAARVSGAAAGSFVEVTSLQTGRVALAVVAPGVPTGGASIEISPGVAAAIGAGDRGSVRVRRAVPAPTDQTALLNGQDPAPRLAAPPALLAGLRARLGATPVTVPVTAPRKMAGRAAVTAPRPAPAAKPAPAPKPTPPPSSGPGLYVQLAAFGSADRANALARSVGGSVSAAGSLYRVRLGPYASADAASRGRVAAAARGYPGAQIVRDK